MAISPDKPVTDVTFAYNAAGVVYAKVKATSGSANENSFFGWNSDKTGMSPQTSQGDQDSRRDGLFNLTAGDYYLVLGVEIWTPPYGEAYFDEFSITKVE